MANLEVMALDQATPQLRAPGAGDFYSCPRPVIVTPGALTADVKILDLAATWNNAGVIFTGLNLNVTGTAYDLTSLLVNLQRDGVQRFAITADGDILGNSVSSLDQTSWVLNAGGLTLSGGPRLYRISSTFLGIDNGGGTVRGLSTGQLKTIPKTVGTLGFANVAGAGTRCFVTDATLAIIAGLGTTVVGGGANSVPVYSDGTNWIIG